jgi:hypothetical protein
MSKRRIEAQGWGKKGITVCVRSQTSAKEMEVVSGCYETTMGWKAESA